MTDIPVAAPQDLDSPFDIVIVGAGMAGASLAAECASTGRARVLMVEAEDAPGYHTTGRSAAFWEESYGGPGVVPLTLASGAFLAEGGFLAPRAGLTIGRAEDRERIEGFVDRFAALGVDVRLMDRAQIAAQVPGLRPEWCFGAYEARGADIDVAGLHQYYLALARRSGSVLKVRARIETIARDGAGWQLAWPGGSVRGAIIVNAAGAWADGVAALAGAAPRGITPLRRTIVQLRTDPLPPADMPLTFGIDEDFYFKPQSGRLLVSPHDETPDVAHDVAPEEIDVAIAVDRMEHVLDWRIAALERRWAGLRSFSPDRLPVYGFDAQVPGFFWFAGQGGFGIQTAPAAARLGAQLVLGLGRDAMTETLDAERYAPGRF
ncbi:FAD-binding oxidoreductase [Novosphingobium sp. Fuku2-ISO-50]|uniref:NAD(P)/FAD-dependent oxidoreductase n=1 Tax=Novosphingobium sp. Fuku2-ISO-50 TaxID=1739114 RepID=UPI00076DC42B|nr:FAD-dependent oxidoreductase [Novosphingobium sp. Fuku2-ISO-50]KUR81192.1 FAD-dependent oxidoreductase [Novosphingobium sp. Fuku2-ISO-50]